MTLFTCFCYFHLFLTLFNPFSTFFSRHQNSGTTDSLSSRKSSNASSTGKERRKQWTKTKTNKFGEYSAFDEYYADVEVPSNENYQNPKTTNISAVLDPKSLNKPPVRRRQSIAQKMMGGIGRRVSVMMGKDEIEKMKKLGDKQHKFKNQKSMKGSMFKSMGSGGESPKRNRCDVHVCWKMIEKEKNHKKSQVLTGSSHIFFQRTVSSCLTMPTQHQIQMAKDDKNNLPPPPEIIKPDPQEPKTTYSMSDKLGVLRVERMLPEFKGLTKVYLSNMSLKALPEAFGNLVSVHTLALDNNKFKTVPRVVTKLKQLKCLYMQHNKIDTAR